MYLIDKVTLAGFIPKKGERAAFIKKQETLAEYCSKCNKGHMNHEIEAWGLFRGDELLYTFFEEDTAIKAGKALKYEVRMVRIGWK